MVTNRDILHALIEQEHGGAVAGSFESLCLGDPDWNPNALKLIKGTLKRVAKRADAIGSDAESFIEEIDENLAEEMA